jgi:hypothetical protein
MRNRAKCALCHTVIESVLATEHVLCPCGEIGVAGGQQMLFKAYTSDDNFIRIDDDGNEIKPELAKAKESAEKLLVNMDDLGQIIKDMGTIVESLESLEDYSMRLPLNQYDLLTVLRLVKRVAELVSYAHQNIPQTP